MPFGSTPIKAASTAYKKQHPEKKSSLTWQKHRSQIIKHADNVRRQRGLPYKPCCPIFLRYKLDQTSPISSRKKREQRDRDQHRLLQRVIEVWSPLNTIVLWNFPSVASNSGEERDGEATDTENPDGGVANDSVQKSDSNSGAVEGSRGIESAGLLENLNRNRVPGLEIPAACASQGAMELLGFEQNPQQHFFTGRVGARSIMSELQYQTLSNRINSMSLSV